MEFHIDTHGREPDLAAIAQALETLDPSALVDVDRSGTLRIAASIDGVRLRALLAGIGFAIAATQVREQPSICCGGCSG